MQLTTAMPDTDDATQTTISNNNPQHSEPNHSDSTHIPMTGEMEDLQKKYETLSNRVENLNSVVNVIKDQNESILKKLDEGSQPVRTCGTHLAYPRYPPSSNPNHAYPPSLDMRSGPSYPPSPALFPPGSVYPGPVYPGPVHRDPLHPDPTHRDPTHPGYHSSMTFRSQSRDERPPGPCVAPGTCALPGNLYR